MRIVEGKTMFLTGDEFDNMVNLTARAISPDDILDERNDYDIVEILAEGGAPEDITNCVVTDVPIIRKDPAIYNQFIENLKDVDKDFYNLRLVEVVAGLAFLGKIPDDIENVVIHLSL